MKSRERMARDRPGKAINERKTISGGDGNGDGERRTIVSEVLCHSTD